MDNFKQPKIFVKNCITEYIIKFKAITGISLGEKLRNK